VIISIHGGAFKLGNRKSGELAPMLAGRARGYAVVSVDYRLSGKARFPASDANVPLTQSVDFADKLAASIGSGEVMFERLEGAGHGGSAFTAEANLGRIFTFIDKALNR
jgi:acetyl esterase/lipase